MCIGLVPENTVLQLGGLTRIVNHEAFVILRALVHDLAEEFKGWEGGGVILVNAFAIVRVRFPQNEHVIHVRTESRLDTERVLHRNQEERFQPPAVHEKVANVLVVSPGVVVHTIVQNHK